MALVIQFSLTSLPFVTSRRATDTLYRITSYGPLLLFASDAKCSDDSVSHRLLLLLVSAPVSSDTCLIAARQLAIHIPVAPLASSLSGQYDSTESVFKKRKTHSNEIAFDWRLSGETKRRAF